MFSCDGLSRRGVRVRRSSKKKRSKRTGQAMTEMIILVALVALALVWMVTVMPAAITKHYKGNVKVLASPF